MNHSKWLVFIATALAVMMVDLDITAANLALATIGKDLSISLANAQWIIDGYLIAAAALMPFGGRLTDVYGARRVFLVGLVFFTLVSLAVALAIGPWSIIISRILQGACIAFTFPVAMVIIRYVFPQNQQGFAIGLMVTIAGLSQALGPTVGGSIIHLLSWRWIFYIDVPLGLIALVLGYYAIPKPAPATTTQSLNIGGNSFLVFGLLALITALNEIGRWGIISVAFGSLLLLAIIFLFIFIYREIYAPQPVLDIRLLLNRNFTLVNLVRFNFNFVYFSLLFTLGLYLQNVLGYSALQAGYYLLALTLVFGVLSIPAGKLIDLIGVKQPIIVGLLFLIAGTAVLTFIHPIGMSLMLLALVLIGLAIALLVPATGAAALFAVPQERGGAAMGVFFTGGFIAGALGVSVSGVLLALKSQQKLALLLQTLPVSLNTSQLAYLKEMAAGIRGMVYAPDLFSVGLWQQLLPLVRESFAYAFTDVMWVGVRFAILALLFAWGIQLSMPKK